MSTQYVDLHVKITKEQHDYLRATAYYRGQSLAEIVREILRIVNVPLHTGEEPELQNLFDKKIKEEEK